MSSNFLFRLLEDKQEIEEEDKGNKNKCEMFGGFGFLIQAFLGCVAILILIIKRYLEKPRRPWKIWFYDVSKQMISSTVLHIFNLLISAILSDSKGETDACVWYFITLFLDCTLGAFLSYIFMWLSDGIAKNSDFRCIKTGLYYEEYEKNNKKYYRLKPKLYINQLLVWMVITIICKIILLIMLKICKRFMVNIGVFILSPFTSGKLRLVMVMIIFPIILNGIYFWAVDNILKLKTDDGENPDITQIYEKEEQGQDCENGVEVEIKNQYENKDNIIIGNEIGKETIE